MHDLQLQVIKIMTIAHLKVWCNVVQGCWVIQIIRSSNIVVVLVQAQAY